MYQTRRLEKKLRKQLPKQQFLLLTGARQVGKTTLLKRLQTLLQEQGETTIRLSLENPQRRVLLDQHPEKLFELIPRSQDKIHVFIDEIQYLSDPSNFLKYHYDLHHQQIKLLVSGSSAFYLDKKFTDSLVGRIDIHTLYSLDFHEYLQFQGATGLANYLDQEHFPAAYQHQIHQHYHDYMLYGGYPACVLLQTPAAKQDYLQSLIDRYIQKDIADAGIDHDQKYHYLLKILAAQIGNLVNGNELANTLDLTAATVQKYLYIMEKSFHIMLVRPFFASNIRKELTKMKKVYFLDSGLRNQLLGNTQPLETRVDKGAIIENMVLRQLLVKHPAHHIHYRRTQQKKEVDFVINGRYALEVKTNKHKFDPAHYTSFTNLYPDIPLSPIDRADSIFLASHTS